MPGVGEQQQQEAEREAGQPGHQVHRAPAHRRGQVDAGGLGEAEPEVDREVEQPRGEAALPVPVSAVKRSIGSTSGCTITEKAPTRPSPG